MKRIVTAILILCAVVGATEIYGPRSMGLGGAMVALVDDGTAAYWNPAAFGRRDLIFGADPTWGFGVKDGITEQMNNFRDYYESADELPMDPAQIQNFIIDFQGALEDFNEPGVGVIGNMHAGFATQIGPVAVSWVDMTKLEIGPWVDTYTARLISTTYLDSFEEIVALYGGGLLTTAEFNTLAAQGWRTIEGDGIGLEDDNMSVINSTGFAQHDFAATYAHSFDLKRDNYIAIGASAKFIYAQRYNHQIPFQLEDALTTGPNWLFENILNVGPSSTGTSFSMDLGVQGFVGDFFHFGIMGRNIIPLEIEWDNGDPSTPLDPQVRIGVAFEPIEGLNLALDIDALEVEYTIRTYDPLTGETIQIPVDKVRDLSFGVEWSLADIFDLRAGINTNYNSLIEEQADANFLGCFGFGIHIGEIFHFDLGVMTNTFSSGDHNSHLGGSVALGFAL
ncbi:MAG: hypothetical protein GF399_12830 [Candidatus Coatesbacteria bacterium]|nr:hypothetical protein [Candidatus Coatesbacteria bacterium]